MNNYNSRGGCRYDSDCLDSKICYNASELLLWESFLNQYNEKDSIANNNSSGSQQDPNQMYGSNTASTFCYCNTDILSSIALKELEDIKKQKQGGIYIGDYYTYPCSSSRIAILLYIALGIAFAIAFYVFGRNVKSIMTCLSIRMGWDIDSESDDASDGKCDKKIEEGRNFIHYSYLKGTFPISHLLIFVYSSLQLILIVFDFYSISNPLLFDIIIHIDGFDQYISITNAAELEGYYNVKYSKAEKFLYQKQLIFILQNVFISTHCVSVASQWLFTYQKAVKYGRSKRTRAFSYTPSSVQRDSKLGLMVKSPGSKSKKNSSVGKLKRKLILLVICFFAIVMATLIVCFEKFGLFYVLFPTVVFTLSILVFWIMQGSKISDFVKGVLQKLQKGASAFRLEEQSQGTSNSAAQDTVVERKDSMYQSTPKLWNNHRKSLANARSMASSIEAQENGKGTFASEIDTDLPNGYSPALGKIIGDPEICEVKKRDGGGDDDDGKNGSVVNSSSLSKNTRKPFGKFMSSTFNLDSIKSLSALDGGIGIDLLQAWSRIRSVLIKLSISLFVIALLDVFFIVFGAFPRHAFAPPFLWSLEPLLWRVQLIAYAFCGVALERYCQDSLLALQGEYLPSRNNDYQSEHKRKTENNALQETENSLNDDLNNAKKVEQLHPPSSSAAAAATGTTINNDDLESNMANGNEENQALSRT